MLFIKFQNNYADEFDCSGFVVIKREIWEKYLSKMTNQFFEGGRELSFGSNESFEFNNAKEYLDCFTVSEITNEEYLALHKFFGKSFWRCFLVRFGFFLFFEDELYEELDSP